MGKKNIVLIGMPACGKSTIGVILAKTLGMDFLDTDLLLQKQEGFLLQALIDQKGMAYFLAAEERAIRSLACENTVIATGGSAVYSESGMKHLQGLGAIVYLKLSFQTIETRMVNIHSRGIAMGSDKSFFSLYKKRIPLYEKWGDIQADVENKNVEQSVDLIISLLPQ